MIPSPVCSLYWWIFNFQSGYLGSGSFTRNLNFESMVLDINRINHFTEKHQGNHYQNRKWGPFLENRGNSMGPEIVFQHFEFKYEFRSSEFKAQTIPFRFPDIFFNMHFKTTNSEIINACKTPKESY